MDKSDQQHLSEYKAYQEKLEGLIKLTQDPKTKEILQHRLESVENRILAVTKS